jgi:prepilin-type N-terminal cleavage/methylation domain-containing protein
MNLDVYCNQKGDFLMKKGFTLTEVLIALSIIGVIAAMTIPNLIVSVGQSKTKTQLTKFLADMEQAISLYEYNGGSWASALVSPASLSNAFASVMKNNGNVIKNITLYNVNGSVETYRGGNRQTLTLKNGIDIAFAESNPACNGDSGAYMCSRFLVDIDGQANGLNKHGNDCFIFEVVKDPANGTYSVAPRGVNPSSASYPVKPANTAYRCSGAYGWACAAEILGGLDSQY